MRRNALSWGVLAVAVSIAGCSQESQKRVPAGQAAAKPGTIGTGGAGATLSDDEFVRDVALKNMSDVELSRIALNRAANPEVRSFAQRMVEDHSAINQALESFVSRQSFDWPAQLDEKHRQAVDELQGKLGSDFQVGYLKAMIEEVRNCQSPVLPCATRKSGPTRATTNSRRRSTSGRPSHTPQFKSTSTPLERWNPLSSAR
jgi:putative membrane protein